MILTLGRVSWLQQSNGAPALLNLNHARVPAPDQRARRGATNSSASMRLIDMASFMSSVTSVSFEVETKLSDMSMTCVGARTSRGSSADAHRRASGP